MPRLGLAFSVGGRLKRFSCFIDALPFVGCSSTEFCLLNLLTMLLTFPLDGFVLPSVSPGGGEQAGVDGFGGTSGLGLTSDLGDTGDAGCWDASCTDMVDGGGLLF